MRRWIIPKHLWAQSLCELAESGRSGREGICLWFTPVDANTVVQLTRAAVLRGRLVIRGPLSIQIDPRIISELTDVADRKGLLLAGQIHGHPARFTDLSDVDCALGFRVPQFLSVVAPDYGVRPDTTIAECGFHEFIAGVGYRRLTDAAVGARVEFADVAIPEPLVVGN